MRDDTPIYCRGYYFLDRWLSVFVTFDEQLELREDSDHSLPFAFNCDITTPHYRRGNSIFTCDLYIDILVRADGATYQLEDLEDFQKAFASELFGRTWFDNARREMDWLVDLVESSGFPDFLNEVAPFPRAKTTPT